VLNVLGCDFFLTFYSLVYDQGVASDQVPRDHYQLHDDRIRGETAVAGHVYRGTSEKNAKLAQKLGQLQPFIADSHRNARANWHLLGQPDTFFSLQRCDCDDDLEAVADDEKLDVSILEFGSLWGPPDCEMSCWEQVTERL
jgi:hypothetical protein